MTRVHALGILLGLSLCGWSSGRSNAQEKPGEPAPPPPAIALEIQGLEIEGGLVGPGTFHFALPSPAEGGGPHVLSFAPSIEETTTELLSSGRVQKELELVDEQRDKLREINRAMHEEIRRVFEHRRPGSRPEGGPREGGSKPEQAVDFSKALREAHQNAEKKIEQVLLPHQQKRLQEITLRTSLERTGTVNTLTGERLAKTLEVSDAQKQRIRKKAEQVQKELEEKIAKLRSEAREEILEELTPTQREKLKSLLGDEFRR